MAMIKIQIPNKNLAHVANGLGVGNTGNDELAITTHFIKLATSAGIEKVKEEKAAEVKLIYDTELKDGDIVPGN